MFPKKRFKVIIHFVMKKNSTKPEVEIFIISVEVSLSLSDIAADNQECIKYLENKKIEFSKKDEARDSELTKK